MFTDVGNVRDGSEGADLEATVEVTNLVHFDPTKAFKDHQTYGLFRQNLCHCQNGTGTDTMPKYRTCLILT